MPTRRSSKQSKVVLALYRAATYALAALLVLCIHAAAAERAASMLA